MEPHPHTHPGRLFGLAADVEAATGQWNTSADLNPLTAILAEVRGALQMDVAFVSRIHGRSRIVESVSLDRDVDLPLAAGDSDELEETYCHRIVSNELERVISDTSAYEALFSLEVTRRLQIRSYISATIILRSGYVYGTLCCFSRHQRGDLREADAEALQAVADAIALDIDRGGRLSQRTWH